MDSKKNKYYLLGETTENGTKSTFKIVMNINDKIKVKLTTVGEKIHFDHHYKYIQDTLPLENCLPVKDENGYTTYTLWEFAHIFGDHFYNGGKQLIKNNEVIIVKTPD